MTDFSVLSTLLFDNLVVGVAGSPLIFALFIVFPVLFWVLSKAGIPWQGNIIILSFAGIMMSIGAFVASVGSVAYVPGWVYAAILLIIGWFVWKYLWRGVQGQ